MVSFVMNLEKSQSDDRVYEESARDHNRATQGFAQGSSIHAHTNDESSLHLVKIS